MSVLVCREEAVSDAKRSAAMERELRAGRTVYIKVGTSELQARQEIRSAGKRAGIKVRTSRVSHGVIAGWPGRRP